MIAHLPSTALSSEATGKEFFVPGPMTQKATAEFRAAEEYRAKPDPRDEQHFDRYVAEDR
jgi:hypothetical protein